MRATPSRRTALLTALSGATLGLSLLTAPIGTATADEETVTSAFRPQLVKVMTPSPFLKEKLQGLGLDLTEHAGHDYVEVVLHTAVERRALEAAGFDTTVVIPDLVDRGAEINRLNAAYGKRVGQSPIPSGRTDYRVLEDYNTDMEQLAADRPGLVERFALPRKSLDGRTIYGVEIGAGVKRADDGRPTFLLMGVHHAREWPSGELAMEFAVDLAENYGKDARITALLRKARVIVVPVVNPDGFDLSRTDGQYVDLRELNGSDPTGGSVSILGTPGQAYKRKNCRVLDGQDTPDGTCRATLNSNGGFGIGVDLNRNYGGFWGGPGASGPEPDAEQVFAGVLDPTYRGAAPFSEPETQNIQELVSERQVTMLISNHTFSNLVLRPNGVNPNTIGHDGKPVGDAPDEAALKRVGGRMTAQNGYQNIHGWQLYDTTGTTEDWSYNATGGFGYTFEIGANEFHPPYEEVVGEYLGTGKYAGKGNREAYLVALEHAVDTRYSGVLTGNAPRGAVVRLRKTFDSPTWEGSFKDSLDSVVRVGASREFRWIVNPSTRPVVRSRSYQEVSEEPYRTEVVEGTAPAPNEHNDHELTLAEPADVMRVSLDWATPDDYDLEVYRKQGGELVQVGSSGNLPSQKEFAEIYDAEAGTYVLRVINYASVSPTYTLTTDLHETVTRRTPGKRESYTMTCEKNGKVLQRGTVFIERGQSKRLDLAQCRRSW